MDDLLFKMPVLERPYLESLTTYELIRLAGAFGIDIPQELERIFIISAIMDLASDTAVGDFGLEKPEKAPFVDTPIPWPVPLPKQYNITFIEVIIRDPLWAFTFWEIKSCDKECHEKASNFGGYRLRVSPLPISKTPKKEDSFTIPVGTGDIAWYLGFPPEGGCFKVELCVLRGSKELVLAGSRSFTLPKLFNPLNCGNIGGLANTEVYKNPLIRLSGVEEFQVLRSTDRRSRLKWEEDS